MKKSVFIIILLLSTVGLFEFLPAVEKAQSYVSLENYENQGSSCQALLTDRPWYGKLNYWFFAWIIFVPAFVFSISPNATAWQRGVRIIFAVAICYGLMNLAVHLQWDIRNAPFHQPPFGPNYEGAWRMDCINIAGDGFSYILALFLGWIPACVYVALCLFLWFHYHLRFSKEITERYKTDIVTRILYIGLIVYFVITFIYLMIIAAHVAGLFDAKSVGWMSYFILRPLFIPFDIFLPI